MDEARWFHFPRPQQALDFHLLDLLSSHSLLFLLLLLPVCSVALFQCFKTSVTKVCILLFTIKPV